MLQSFSSQHALCHFVNLNRISRTDKRASMQLGAASLCPTPPPSHSCWLSLGLKGRGRGRSIIILGQLPSSSPKPQSDTEFSSVWVYCTHKWLAHRQRETLTALTILTATFTNVNANTFTQHTPWVFSVDFFIFFSQVSHFLRVPQTLRQLIINAASWQHWQPLSPHLPNTLLPLCTFCKAYNNENVGAKANEPIKIPEAGTKNMERSGRRNKNEGKEKEKKRKILSNKSRAKFIQRISCDQHINIIILYIHSAYIVFINTHSQLCLPSLPCHPTLFMLFFLHVPKFHMTLMHCAKMLETVFCLRNFNGGLWLWFVMLDECERILRWMYDYYLVIFDYYL